MNERSIPSSDGAKGVLPNGRCVVRRRSELNAKRNSTAFVALIALSGMLDIVAPAFTARAADPAPANSPKSQSANGRELTRADVDTLLRQAHAAIQQGNLDQAEALLTRAENAHAHYPVWHFGMTPSSVRRELAQAARQSGGKKRPQAGPQNGAQTENRFASGAPSPTDRGDQGANKNPFEGRSMPLPPLNANNGVAAANNMPLPAGPSTRPLPPTTPSGGYDDPSSITESSADGMPSLGRPVANPFAATTGSADTAGIDATEQASYANSQPSAVALPINPGDASPQGAALAEGGNWRLPDAPLPPALGGSSAAVDHGNGLAAPQRSAYQVAGQTASNARPVGTVQKQQVLTRLKTARQALNEGNLELAEKLVREASAAGVPESQFLPDEDRPSQLAWDIVRAQQDQHAVQPAVSTATVGAKRYAQQAGEAPAGAVSAVIQAAGPQPVQPFDSDERWAMVPEPLSLPSESMPPADVAAPLPQSTAQAQSQVPPRQPANEAADLLDAGEAALRMHDRKSALELLNQAHVMRDQLDRADRDRLQEHLHMLAAEPVDRQIPAANEPPVARQAQLSIPPRSDSAPAEQFPSESTPFGSDDQSLTNPGTQPGAFAPSNNSPLPSSRTPSTLSADPSHNAAAQPDEFEAPADASVAPPARRAANPSLMDTATQNDRALAQQLSSEVGKRQSEAQRLLEKDPDRAKEILLEAQQLVKSSKISAEYRRDLLSRIEITLTKTDKYINDHKAEIELDRANEAVMDSVERDRELKAKLEQKKAELVEQFNQLRDQQRYPEMEVVARRLYEMAPDDAVAQQVWDTAKFIRREYINRQIADDKEQANWETWKDVDNSSYANVGDGREVAYDAKIWDNLAKKRLGSRERTERRTQRELEIERRLKTPVMLKYQDTPLSQVMDGLSALTGINIHLDPRGLSQEGVHSDTPVTVNLNKEVSLKSALNLILEPLHLSYVVKDEVLKITSEQLRDGEIYAKIYNVADLVIPIPNFVPNSNIGLQGLINDAHTAMGYGNSGFGAGPTVLVNDRGKNNPNVAATNKDVVAQQFAASSTNSSPPQTVPIGAGPGGMGGGANADFDSLIDLIVSTVSTETWAENGGGEAEIRPFPTNLSLVISQTQAVHEEIADLLEQLRRLQDLQITIEVRFIRLNDRFFERIGVDFQMNIEDRTIGTADLVPGQVFEPGRQSAIVGLQPPVLPNNPFPNYTTDLDIPFRQGSFAATQLVPFGGQVQGAATFGFAILSDLEAFFLIEAAQSDSRTNVLNAPKVTLFNGQQAFVADTTQRPFVIGVIPVVGEFVAAQQPVIVVLNEGTMMTIQAVVSDDRRYIRLTVVPFFTQIGQVDEFTFEGASSSTSSSSSTDDDDDGKDESEEDSKSESRSGVTVQLPSFSFVSVVTTVSVPDGGTVLLGGIKRLSEGRNEFGVPLLSKIPYVDRLFRNVGIGRTTESLMMMVTPRIIIQEEEEERLGINTP